MGVKKAKARKIFSSPRLFRFSPVLFAEVAAVYGDDRAGDVVARGAGEEERDALEVVGLSPAVRGDAARYLFVVARVGRLDVFRERRLHVAGRYRVDADAAACPFVCERLRELRDAALARGVGGDALAAEE